MASCYGVADLSYLIGVTRNKLKNYTEYLVGTFHIDINTFSGEEKDILTAALCVLLDGQV